MAQARTSASVLTLPDGRLAVIGGHKRGRKPYSYRFHSSVEVFDPSSASWIVMDAVMKLPRATCLAGLLGGGSPGSETLVVTGGWAGPFRHTCTGMCSQIHSVLSAEVDCSTTCSMHGTFGMIVYGGGQTVRVGNWHDMQNHRSRAAQSRRC